MPTVDFSGAQIEAIRGQLDSDAKTLKLKDARLAALEVHQGDPPWNGEGGGPGALDFIPKTRDSGGGGIEVDPAVARAADIPCLCYEIQKRGGGTGELCFKHGVVGALDKEQIEVFCEVKEARPPTPEQKLRLEAFQDSAETCSSQVAEIPKGEELEPFLTCMSKELTKRNRTLSGGELLPPLPDSTPMPDEGKVMAGGGLDTPSPSATPEEWQRRAALINQVEEARQRRLTSFEPRPIHGECGMRHDPSETSCEEFGASRRDWAGRAPRTGGGETGGDPCPVCHGNHAPGDPNYPGCVSVQQERRRDERRHHNRRGPHDDAPDVQINLPAPDPAGREARMTAQIREYAPLPPPEGGGDDEPTLGEFQADAAIEQADDDEGAGYDDEPDVTADFPVDATIEQAD